MTEDETKEILMRIQAVYPNWKPQVPLRVLTETWHDYLKGYSKGHILLAVNTYVTTNTSGFAPSVGQILETLQHITTPEELNEMEAWTLVSKAISNGYYGANEEFAKLPPLVQEAVGSPQQLSRWATAEISSIESVAQSNFMRTYRAVLEQSKQIERMPLEIRNLLESVNKNSYKLQIETNNLKMLESDKNNNMSNDENYIPMLDEMMKHFLERISRT